MSAFGTAIGQLAESYGGALDIRERQKLDEHNIDIDNARLKLEQQAAERQQADQRLRQLLAKKPIPLGKPFQANGKTYQRYWDTMQGKITEMEDPGEDPMAQLRMILGREPSQTEREVYAGVKRPEETTKPKFSSEHPVRDPKSPTGWSWQSLDENTAKPGPLIAGAPNPYVGKEKPGGSATTGNPKLISDLASRWEKGDAPPAKFRADVEQYMEEHGMRTGRKLNAQENRILDLTNQIEPKVGQLKKLIEDSGLTDSNDWVFGDRSAMMQHLRMWGYRTGHAPDKLGGDLIKAAAALQVMGAGPWMQMGRGRYLFETIKQHLPSPTDTPQQLYQKAIFLQGIVDEAKGSLDVNQAGSTQSGPSSTPKVVIGKDGSITVQ